MIRTITKVSSCSTLIHSFIAVTHLPDGELYEQMHQTSAVIRIRPWQVYLFEPLQVYFLDSQQDLPMTPFSPSPGGAAGGIWMERNEG